MATKVRELAASAPGVSAGVLALRAEPTSGAMKPIARLMLIGREVSIRQAHDAIWAIVRRPDRGGPAVRVAHTPGGCTKVRKRGATTEALTLEVRWW